MTTLQATYNKLRDIVDEDIESFEAVSLVDAYRQYFKPEKVKTILLAESHVFTSTEDMSIVTRDIDELPGYPNRYARFVYCLSCGERQLTEDHRHLIRDGSPQFWKVLFSCTNAIEKIEDFKPILSATPDAKRLENKIKTLKTLKEKGIWLVDASIIALYHRGKKITKMKQALRTSWEHHTRQIIYDAQPEHIICIGKGVAKVVEDDLNTQFGQRYSVVDQPNAHLSAQAHLQNLIHYSNVCVA